MADIHDKKTRSFNMSQVKSKNTRPELVVRSFLHQNGFRYKLHDKTKPGCPDIVLPKFNTAIFVNGCFWHGHEKCRSAKLPKTNIEWWRNKINRNISNDATKIKSLTQLGWRVITVWGCTLKPTCSPITLNRLKETLLNINKNQPFINNA